MLAQRQSSRLRQGNMSCLYLASLMVVLPAQITPRKQSWVIYCSINHLALNWKAIRMNQIGQRVRSCTIGFPIEPTIVPTGDGSLSPTSGEYNSRTTLFAQKDGRLLEKTGHDMGMYEMGQGELMRSIHFPWIPLILIVINQSHLLPLLQLSPPIHIWSDSPTSAVTPLYSFFVTILTNPYALCYMFSMFRILPIIISSYHTFISQLWRFWLLSAPLSIHWLHILYCVLFLFLSFNRVGWPS